MFQDILEKNLNVIKNRWPWLAEKHLKKKSKRLS